MKITGERTRVQPEDEEQLLIVASERALKNGTPLRVGYTGDESLAVLGKYNPKLVSELRIGAGYNSVEVVPVIRKENMLDFAAGDPMRWFTATGSSLYDAIRDLEKDSATRQRQFTCRGELRADALPDLLSALDAKELPQENEDWLWSRFSSHHIDFLRDCSANLLDQAVIVELDPTF